MHMKQAASLSSSRLHDLRRQTWGQLFGTMIMGTREAAGRSVEEAAHLAGMETSEWMAIEDGFVPQDGSRLQAMAAAMEIRYDQMAVAAFLCRDAWEL
jgi:hypothetical protein